MRHKSKLTILIIIIVLQIASAITLTTLAIVTGSSKFSVILLAISGSFFVIQNIVYVIDTKS